MGLPKPVLHVLSVLEVVVSSLHRGFEGLEEGGTVLGFP
jgi:hypothetical protein